MSGSREGPQYSVGAVVLCMIVSLYYCRRLLIISRILSSKKSMSSLSVAELHGIVLAQFHVFFSHFSSTYSALLAEYELRKWFRNLSTVKFRSTQPSTSVQLRCYRRLEFGTPAIAEGVAIML